MSILRAHGLTSVAWGLIVLAGSLAGCGGARPDAGQDSLDPLESVEARELYRRGALLGGAGDYIRAEQYIAAAIERGFPEDEAMPMLMQVCVEASRLVAALEYAEPYLLRHPDQWSLRMLVASIHLGLGHDERARDELIRVLEDADDEPAQAHYLLGTLFRDELEDQQSSLLHFRRYLELEPDGPHRDEARAALPGAERGLPPPVAPTSEEASDDGAGDAATPPQPVQTQRALPQRVPSDAEVVGDPDRRHEGGEP